MLRVPETLAVLSLLLSVAAAAAQPHALRYTWTPGAEWVYTQRTGSPAGDRGAGSTCRIHVHCLAWDGHAALLLLVREPEAGEAVLEFGLLRAGAGGQRTWPPEMLPRRGALRSALELLPLLPGPTQDPAAWTAPGEELGRLYRCTKRGSDAGRAVLVEFAGEETIELAAASAWSHAGRYWFDPQHGLVVRAESREQDGHAGHDVQRTAELRERITHTPTWAARRAAEAERFLQRLRHAARVEKTLLVEPEHVEARLAQLDQIWAGFVSDIDARSDSPFVAISAALRRQVRGQAAQHRVQAALAGRWLRQAARPWSLQDPDGHTVTSEALRKGRTLECYWSGAAPAAVRLVRELLAWRPPPNAAPVPLLFYNMDEDVHFARRVIAALPPGGTHVLGAPLRAAEEFPELPILRLVGTDGTVQAIWVGADIDWAALTGVVYGSGN